MRVSSSAWAVAVVLSANPAGIHKAAERAGIGKLPTHTLRHSYRSWLDAVGTPIAVQQKLMRHTDIRTTMNLYGDVVTDEMAQAHSKVVGLALSSSG
ncbi:MAG: tyrosine-type recombinase/integrase [Candidatus Sulfotelmatobacter sp.]|jgi:integrase